MERKVREIFSFLTSSVKSWKGFRKKKGDIVIRQIVTLLPDEDPQKIREEVYKLFDEAEQVESICLTAKK